jgi:hypothetical protein
MRNYGRRGAFGSAAFAVALTALSNQVSGQVPAVSRVGSGGQTLARIDVPIVFVSRQIPDRGSIYWSVPNAMPGVGAHSRVRPAAPGQLLVRERNGRIRVLVDGGNPSAASLNLIDMNAPAVSYDGRTIVFAGLPQGNWNTNPGVSVGGWRLYAIAADGSNLRQVTFSDRGNIDYSQFGANANLFRSYDDFDPVFLPDGRVCFASTRYPAMAQYSGVRASNLYVVNLDGTRLHRITAERNGAERPLVDPPSGRLVYSRWWRNHRLPCDSMETVETEVGPEVYGYSGPAYLRHEGLTWQPANAVGGDGIVRNAWQASFLNPDGTKLQMWGLRFRDQDINQIYGGAFSDGGVFYANYFPMLNMSEASGFGGIRLRFHGTQTFIPFIGVTDPHRPLVNADPPSFGIYQGDYAADPDVLPDGRIVISWTADVLQDYGLYVVNSDGSGLSPLFDRVGTSELRARVLGSRALPEILADVYRDDPSRPFAAEMPPLAQGPYNIDGEFAFHCLNVFANGPVDSDIVSAPGVGSAATIRFFIDQQRTSPGSFPHIDWPILLGERAISPAGEVLEPHAPANVSLFEQLRGHSPHYRVPLTGGPYPDGAAHVPGMNFGVAGTVARCVGCHAGHTIIPVPDDAAEAAWTNVAPGAAITVSSARDARYNGGLIDRRAFSGEIWRFWNSSPNQPQDGQWVQLAFRVPISVRTVRLYNPRFGDEAGSTIQVHRATVILYADSNASFEVARQVVENLDISGTDADFAEPMARSIRVVLDDVSGTFYGMALASLAEIEVIGRGEDPRSLPDIAAAHP